MGLGAGAGGGALTAVGGNVFRGLVRGEVQHSHSIGRHVRYTSRTEAVQRYKGQYHRHERSSHDRSPRRRSERSRLLSKVCNPMHTTQRPKHES